MIKILAYLKDQYLAVIIAIIWVFSIIYTQHKNALLIEQTKILETKVLVLEQKDHKSSKIIDSLAKIDTIIINRIKIIKQKENVQIRIIDSLPISGLQKYFTDRYKER